MAKIGNKARPTPESITLHPEDACIILRGGDTRRIELFIPHQGPDDEVFTQSRIAFALAFAAGESDILSALEETALTIATQRMKASGETPPPDIDQGGGDSGPTNGGTVH